MRRNVARNGKRQMTFTRPEHQTIADMLGRMDSRLLMDSRCFFGGGTAIVLRLGEYRRSLDVDFLCSSTDGYMKLRNAVASSGPGALFLEEVASAREVRTDQYGIRMFLRHREQPVKFEIIRESRIEVDGEMDRVLNVPTLLQRDMFAEKLLANADRCMDRSVAYRDAIDLGKLVQACGGIPEDALAKALKAYGPDIERKTVWVVNRLQDREELRHAAEALQMDHTVAAEAIVALRQDCRRLWPEAKVDDEPPEASGRRLE